MPRRGARSRRSAGAREPSKPQRRDLRRGAAVGGPEAGGALGGVRTHEALELHRAGLHLERGGPRRHRRKLRECAGKPLHGGAPLAAEEAAVGGKTAGPRRLIEPHVLEQRGVGAQRERAARPPGAQVGAEEVLHALQRVGLGIARRHRVGRENPFDGEDAGLSFAAVVEMGQAADAAEAAASGRVSLAGKRRGRRDGVFLVQVVVEIEREGACRALHRRIAPLEAEARALHRARAGTAGCW